MGGCFPFYIVSTQSIFFLFLSTNFHLLASEYAKFRCSNELVEWVIILHSENDWTSVSEMSMQLQSERKLLIAMIGCRNNILEHLRVAYTDCFTLCTVVDIIFFSLILFLLHGMAHFKYRNKYNIPFKCRGRINLRTKLCVNVSWIILFHCSKLLTAVCNLLTDNTYSRHSCVYCSTCAVYFNMLQVYCNTCAVYINIL